MDSEEGCPRIEQDIGQIESWARHWQVDLNPNHYKVLHFRSQIRGGYIQ